MPCNSEHMAQTPKEQSIQHAAELFGAAFLLRGERVPLWVIESQTYYAKDEDIIPGLCAYLRELSEADRDELLYSDARNPERRSLASWWEKHLQVDRAREEKEALELSESELRLSARAKLTNGELRSLGLYTDEDS